ncbi:uncharacterized oxidoreductase [Chitinophaga sp. YR627]|uniref:SDR family oxidoreductase n=1 Tax=Chitinophaga sp. YR627 TaxID=1881041 RepID=UPI0008DF0E1E|nr:SDR family NAD(P)-dependent oxidoreductase [Chitinophaga sp. YR627]SFO54281.1 uncharacterized oxidoreductase [Chitinophaga sp. YR627]
MNTTGKTLLVTGGASGIGFQIAKLFSENGNKVIITGRNEAKLKEAAASLKNTDYFAADVANEQDLDRLVTYIKSTHPGLDILVNNAATTNVYQMGVNAGAYEKAKDEVATNYLAVVHLTEKLLPVLEKQQDAAIVNVNAIIGLTPSIHMPTHSASKAALRAYTQALRFTFETKGTGIKVFDLVPPLVNTEFSRAIGSATNGIPAEEVAEALLQGLKNDTFEIRIGKADQFYQAFFAGSENAVSALNQPQGKA